MTTEENAERQYRVLVYGADKVGLAIPLPITGRNFSVDFEAYGVDCRFDEYDAVITFQGIFEKLKRVSSGYGRPYWDHDWDADELDKRKKELLQLLRNGGFACFLLVTPMITSIDGKSITGTDLAKYCVTHDSLHWKYFKDRARVTGVRPIVSEFERFLDRWGAAYNYFEYYGRGLTIREIARFGNASVGARFGNNIYAIPSLVPPDTEEELKQYFTSLVSALVALENKRTHELPDWVREFEFADEPSLAEKRSDLEAELDSIGEEQSQLEEFKLALVASGDDLVAAVTRVFEQGFDIPVDAVDEFKEDIKLLDDAKDAFAIAEIKGTNRGVKREHVNQADSHRERSGFDPDFPALLIMNTHIKNARTVAEKDKEIPADQVTHAANNNILILRTLDLLDLLRRVRSGSITREGAMKLLLESVGWLQVGGDGIVVHPATAQD